MLLLWLTHWAGTGRLGVVPPLDVSLLVLLLMVPVAVWVSSFPALTLPKLAGLVLGVAAFRATLFAVRGPRHLTIAAALYLALGLALAAIGLVSVAWLHKWPVLDAIVGHLPRLIG